MTRLTIVTTPANSGLGTNLKAAGDILNANFVEIYKPLERLLAAEAAAGVTVVQAGYPPLTVDRYGVNAVPGTTNMSAAISAAIAVASQAQGPFSLGGTIRYLNAVYLVSTPISYVANYISHEGDNAFGTILVNGSTNAALFTIGDGATQLSGGGFANLRFSTATGVSAVDGNAAFVMKKCQFFNIENVEISNPFAALYRGCQFNNCSQYAIRNLQVSSCLLDGITKISCADSYVTDCRSDFNGGAGWNIESCQGGYYKSCTSFSNTSDGWFLVSGLPATAPNFNNFFINCIGDTSGNHNWLISDSVDCYWVGCWGSSQLSPVVNTPASGFFIKTVNSKHLFFTACVAQFNNAHGFQIFDSGANAPADITFVNCQGGSPGVTINLGNGQGGAGYGLAFNGVSNQVRVLGGSFLGNVTGSILNQSSGTDNVISGNPTGFVTNNEGTATITVGSASVAVTHGLGFSPGARNIQLTDTSSRAASSINSLWVSATSATTFTVSANANVATSNFTFAWRAGAHGT